MDTSLMKAALWRFTHRKRDWRRITAWTLVLCMAIITAGSFWQERQTETGGLTVVTYQETPTVLMPAAAWSWNLFSAEQIESYFAKTGSPLAGKGVGVAIMEACWTYRYYHVRPGDPAGEYMILRPDVLVGMMYHESNGGRSFGLPPYNNPLSWGIPSNWAELPASSYSFSSVPACVQYVLGNSRGIRMYLQDKGSHSHGPSLEGIAVDYVGGPASTAATNDAQWVAGVNRYIADYQKTVMTMEQRALLAMISTETLRPGGTAAGYLDAPISRRELAVLLYRQSGGK